MDIVTDSSDIIKGIFT